VDVQTTYDFSIVFEAVHKPDAAIPTPYPSVHIDDVQFVKVPCNQMHELSFNCSFEKDLGKDVIDFTPCGWTNDSGWIAAIEDERRKFVALDYDESFGQIVSPTLRSTNKQTHCILFDYFFDRKDSTILSDSIILSVIVKNKDLNNTGPDLLVWSKSSSPYWTPADVPVLTTFDFVIVFQAERLSPETLNSGITVYVDNVA
jgi:hypothetical protein